MNLDWLASILLGVLKKRFLRESREGRTRRTRQLQWEYMLSVLKPQCGPPPRLSSEDMREARDFLRSFLASVIAFHRERGLKRSMVRDDFEELVSFWEDFYERAQTLICSHGRVPEDKDEEDKVFKMLTGLLAKCYWI